MERTRQSEFGVKVTLEGVARAYKREEYQTNKMEEYQIKRRTCFARYHNPSQLYAGTHPGYATGKSNGM